MTIIICQVCSGMCNRIIPFITSYMLSLKLNCTYFLDWDDKMGDSDYKYNGILTTYDDLFLRNNDINYINKYQINNLIQNKNCLIIDYMPYKKMDNLTIDKIKKYDILFFKNVTTPIYTVEDKLQFHSYSEYISLKEMNKKLKYFYDIEKMFKKIKLQDNIKKKIEEVSYKIDKNTIGIHLRHWPTTFLMKEDVKKNYINDNYHKKRIKFMKQEISKNKNIKFFVSTSDKEKLTELIEIFDNRIIYFKNRFGGIEDHFYLSNEKKSFCTKNKNLNGIVDLYLLSKCNIIYGDVCSSFPITSKFMNTNCEYKLIWKDNIENT